MDSEKIMSGISNEIFTTLKIMEKAKTPEEKMMYSEIVKNLCDSLGVFLSYMSDIALYEDDEPIPF
ncbi:MAG TPA: hypothetical protein ENI68_08610 [Gammaproteobacteria bacterium]|nr:hypothetical protein [Gammaproteobacteria bacterium]